MPVVITEEATGWGKLTCENKVGVNGWLAPDGKLWWFKEQWSHHLYAPLLVEMYYPEVYASHVKWQDLDWKEYLILDRGWFTVWEQGGLSDYGDTPLTQAQLDTLMDLITLAGESGYAKNLNEALREVM